MTPQDFLFDLFLNPFRIGGDINGVSIMFYTVSLAFIVLGFFEHRQGRT